MAADLGGRSSRLSSRQDFVTFEDSLRRLNALELKLTETVKGDISTLKKTWTMPKVERVSRSAFKLFEIREKLKYSKSLFMEEEVILGEFNEVQRMLKEMPMDEDDYEETKENCFFLGVKLKDVRNKQGTTYSEIKDLEVKIQHEIAQYKFEQSDMRLLDIEEVRSTTPTHQIMEEIRSNRASRARSREPSPFLMPPLTGMPKVDYRSSQFNIEDIQVDHDNVEERCITPMSDMSLPDSRPGSRNSMLGDVVSLGIPLEDLEGFKQEIDMKIQAQPSLDSEESPLIQRLNDVNQKPFSSLDTSAKTEDKPVSKALEETKKITEFEVKEDSMSPQFANFTSQRKKHMEFSPERDDFDDDDGDLLSDLLQIGGDKTAAAKLEPEIKPAEEKEQELSISKEETAKKDSITEKATLAQDKPKEDPKRSETKKTITITAEVKEAAEKDDKKPVKKNSSLDKKESASKTKAKRDSSLTKAKSTEKEAPKDDKKVIKRDRSKSATRKEDTKESTSAKDDTVAMETDGAVKDQSVSDTLKSELLEDSLTQPTAAAETQIQDLTSMVETNLAPLAAATAASGGQVAATESKMSAANKSKMSSKLSSMDSEVPPMETVTFQGDVSTYYGEEPLGDEYSAYNQNMDMETDIHYKDDGYAQQSYFEGDDYNNQYQDERVMEDFYDRDEPMSYREQRPNDYGMQDEQDYGYGMEDNKVGTGYPDGEFGETEPIYSTVRKPKTSESSRYEMSQYESEDAPRQGIIRRPDSRSSKNVTFDAAPPGATILGEDGRQSEAGAALNAEQKGFLSTMTKGILSGSTSQILQSGMESLKYIVKKSNMGIKQALERVDFKPGKMTPQDQQQMFDQLFGHVEPNQQITQDAQPLAITQGAGDASNMFQSQIAQQMPEDKYSGEEKERFMKKMFEYTNPESIQLSPAPQRDLFTGAQIGDSYGETEQQLEFTQQQQQWRNEEDNFNFSQSQQPNRNDNMMFNEPPRPQIPDVSQNLPPVLRLDHLATPEDYSYTGQASIKPPSTPPPSTNDTVRKYIIDSAAARMEVSKSRPLATSDNIIVATKQMNVRSAAYNIQDLVEIRRQELKEKKAWIQNGMMGALGFCVMLYLQSVEQYSYM